MKMIRLLWQEDPKGLTRTAILRFLRHGPRTFYWNLPGQQKSSFGTSGGVAVGRRQAVDWQRR